MARPANASHSPASATPSLATAQQKLSAMSIPFVPNGGQWDARAAFAAQTFAGTLFVTTEGQLVYSLPGKRAACVSTSPFGRGRDANAARVRENYATCPEPSPALSGTLSQKEREKTPGWALTETLVDTSGQPRSMTQSPLKAPAGDRPLERKVSYATAQQTGSLNTYERVNLGDMYPGINVQLCAAHSTAGNNVEKIFTVAPQRDPKQIRIKLAGAEKLEINAQGELIAHTGNGPVAFTAPIAFQENDQGERVMVDVAYQLVGADLAAPPHSVGADLAALSGTHPSDAKSSPTPASDADLLRRGESPTDRATTYTFTLGDYDTTRPLVIDPLLASTYLGGGSFDQINAIAVHPHTGQVYVAGETQSSPFPQSGSGAQPIASGYSCFVSRYSADLQQLLQSTYVGNGLVSCLAIAIHPGSGAVYVAGSATGTSNFEASSMAGAIQFFHADRNSSGLTDGFVALLSADLRNLTKATFFGGITPQPAEQINAIAVHPLTGFVHIVGTTRSSTLPGTAVGTQTTSGGGPDAFVARLPADLMNATNVRYTFIGGNTADIGKALAIDPRSGDVFVAGYTQGGLPTAMLSGAAQVTHAGAIDAFVARIKQDLSAVVRATYLGGASNDRARSIALHPLSGEVVVAGVTQSGDFPQVTYGAQPIVGGSFDGFVSRLSADLTAILQSTYLGGAGEDCNGVCQVAIHPQSGEVFVTGATSGGLPAALVADGYLSSYGGGFYDTFVVRLNAALTARRAGTYLGGAGRDGPRAIAIEPNGGSVYVAGLNDAGGFPMMNAQQSTSASFEGFVSRFSTDLTAVNRTPNPFSFIHQSNVPPNSTRTSNEVQLVITPNPGNNQQSAYVTGAAGSELCVANQPGRCVTPFVACDPPCYATNWFPGPWEFVSGDYIAVRHSSAVSGTTETKLIISGTAYPFRTSTGNANIACNLDMNGDNGLSATVEGLILVRAMLGFNAAAIVANTGVTAWNPIRDQLNQFCGTKFQ
jgi:hypothetical protein